MTATRLVSVLKAEGLRVVEYRGWRTHNRNAKGPWGPVHGVMIHHTVTKGDTPAQTEASVALCYNGHSLLPGPLCHGVIAKDGTVYLVGHGRANHAGKGDGDVLDAVVDERPLPVDNEADTDGNPYFYGFEAINLGNGKDPWPDAQLEAIERVSAAICREHGWSERSVIGHKEWQPGKIDPTFSMTGCRTRVGVQLDRLPKPPVPPKENPMALSDDDIRRIWRYQNEAIEPDRDAYQIMRDTSAGVRHLIADDLDPAGLTDEQLTALMNILAAEQARRSGGA
jgi:hypothetical protein